MGCFYRCSSKDRTHPPSIILSYPRLRTLIEMALIEMPLIEKDGAPVTAILTASSAASL